MRCVAPYALKWPSRLKATSVSPADAACSTASDDGAETADEHRDAGEVRLLRELERRPARHLEHRAAQRNPTVAQGPADHLVDGVVAPDVLAEAQQLTAGVEQAGRVHATGAVEHRLVLTQPVGQGGHQLALEHRVVVGHRSMGDLVDCLDRRRAADAARAGRVDVPLQRRVGQRDAGASTASTTLNVCRPCSSVPAQNRIAASWSADQITPSETRKPATRSKSSPGVRIVTTYGEPPSRISSGSSTASASSRTVDGLSGGRTARPGCGGYGVRPLPRPPRPRVRTWRRPRRSPRGCPRPCRRRGRPRIRR